MTTSLIILILVMSSSITAGLFYTIGYYKGVKKGKAIDLNIKIKEATSIKSTTPLIDILTQVNNLVALHKLHPLVIEIYNDFIDTKKLKYLEVTEHHFTVLHIPLTIWAANGVEAIHFIKVPDEILHKYNCTLTELNQNLTVGDKEVLHRIIEAIRINNKAFISRLFTT